MPESGKEKATATAADKPAVFGDITYELPGVYTYQVVETNGGEDGMSYDVDEDGKTKVHTVVVTVEKDAESGYNNTLKATIKYDGADSLTATNIKTESNPVDIGVSKNFNKWDLPGVDKFEFTLKAGKAIEIDPDMI